MMEKGMFLGNPQLETERLQLRKIERDDRDAIFNYASDPKVTRYVTWPLHKNIADTEEFLESWVEKSYSEESGADWGIIWKVTGEFIGTIGLVNPNLVNQQVEIGYVLSKEFWGKGIVTEALKCLIDFVFRNNLFNRIQGVYHLDNIGSSRVMEKAGMTYEGVLREGLYVEGEYWDIGRRAILKKDWEEMTKKGK